MLRGQSDLMKLAEIPPRYEVKPEGAFPGVDQPFTTGEHPLGVMFYRSKESFFFPYHLLQSIRFFDEQVNLVFATADVVVTGRGLHQLYIQLAAQRVSRIVEQGERYAGETDNPVFIKKIVEIPREE